MKEEKFFLAAKAIKESIIRNQSIEDGGSNCPIIVEGINDIKCLRILGFTGIIETINKGWDRSRIIAYFYEKYGSELAVDGLPRIILLMDWDRTGDVLQESFNNRLSSMDMKVDQTLRNVLSKQLRSECRTVESISSIESLLEILSLI
jgi:5S rRNA maturation endonuclease (ribonuclease M5)|tara:strand:+ start:126 stop:569 length:444 start_codon:yes stop_codon:yes gene_type:complete